MATGRRLQAGATQLDMDHSLFPLLIGGQLVDGDKRMDVINPATGRIFASCARASGRQLDDAVASAANAFAAWSTAEPKFRRKVLLDVADRIDANVAELAEMLTREQGKTLMDSAEEVRATAGFFRQFAELKVEPETYASTEARHIEGNRRPFGVVAAIVPWNFPLVLMAMKIPPALIAGNCVVLKPAATTPLTTLRLGALICDLIPPGVLNIIADDNDLGAALVAHPAVKRVAFTGSTETGRKVMAGAARNLSRLTLELGGNDPGIVLDDVDPSAIAPRIFRAAFRNAGQVCMALKRLYVHEAVHDELCDALEKLAAEAIVGNGMTGATTIGPVQNEAQYLKVRALLDTARQAGGSVSGGENPVGEGYFIRPAIVRGMSTDSQLVAEEQFGPVLPVVKFKDAYQALEWANDSPYGLGGSVWSSNTDRATALARQLDVGTAWVNNHLELAFAAPFGGAKQSGLGHELGLDALKEYTQLSVLNVAHG